MTKPYNKVKCFKLHTKFDLDMIEELRNLAKSKGIYVSQLVRSYIKDGLEKENRNENK